MLRRAWQFLTDDHVVGTTPEVHRHFLRCENCGRVFMHFWGCKEAHERGRLGCPCGGIKARIAAIPEWLAAYYVITRYLWRKVLLRKRYWDPRFPSRVTHAES